MNSKVLFFEGPPGAGKSTLSEYVAEQMRFQGVPVHWIEEHELEDKYLSKFMSAPHGQALNELLEAWKRLAADIEALDKVTVIDGAFFGNSIKFLFGDGPSDDEILCAQAALQQIFAPANPCVVYLGGDVVRAMQRAMDERGQKWAHHIATEVNKYPYQLERERSGINGMVEFFVDSYVLFDKLLANCPFRQIRINTDTSDWKAIQTKLLHELGLEEIALPETVPVDPELYTGVYNTPAYFPEQFNRPLRVDADSEGLLLHVWFHDNFRLIFESTTVFHIRSKPWRVEFVMDENGQAKELVYPFIPQRHLCVREKGDAVEEGAS